MNLLMGIDLGTSGVKVAVFDIKGNVKASGTDTYRTYYPKDKFAEQNPNDWYTAVCGVCKRIFKEQGISPLDIKSIGIDGMCWNLVCLDSSGEVINKTPIWTDSRASDICDNLKAKYGNERFWSVSGNSLEGFYLTGKLLWLKQNLPEVYEKTDKILQSNSFIGYKLTGRLSSDISQAYGYHFFDMRNGKWDYEMMTELGINREFFPDIVNCHEVIGEVTSKAAIETGLKEGTPVVAGGLDAACGSLGVGVIDSGQTQEQGGQAGGMSICLDRYAADPRLIMSFHVVPNRWLLQGGTTGGGGVMRWFEAEFGDYERSVAKAKGLSSLEQLNEEAKKVDAGSDGLVFLPYMRGERSPIWNDKAKGVYYGMDFSKTKGHFVRAAMEGVAYSVKHNLDIAEKTGAKCDTLRSMGGAANSLLWTQIKSDIYGKVIEVPSSDTATTLGAAILAGVGVGLYKDFKEATDMAVKVKRVHKPDMENHEKYKKNYNTYLKLYEKLEDMMKEEEN